MDDRIWTIEREAVKRQDFYIKLIITQNRTQGLLKVKSYCVTWTYEEEVGSSEDIEDR